MGVIPTLAEGKFRIGDVVLVRRGRHAGAQFVVVGTEGESRVLITDGRNYRAGKPKRKNAAHLQKTLLNLEDVAGRVESGKTLDNGWLIQRMSSLSGGASCRQGG